MRTRLLLAGILAATAVAAPAAANASAPDVALHTYEVTITNLAATQPISPPVFATHEPSVRFWQPGEPASAELVAIAEDGDPAPAEAFLGGLEGVTAVVNVGVPLGLAGSTGELSDTATFTIQGYSGDRLSFAGMLICTNDGFVGADSIALPGSSDVKTGFARGWDAGSEINTERSEDIVDGCNDLGPVLIGDQDGNENDSVDADGLISRHRGIVGESDLLVDHNWRSKVVMVTIERLD